MKGRTPLKRAATLADVAAAAGVSKMTASRALRGAGDVSERSIEKVRRAASEIGYVANPLASSLSARKTNLLGVVVPSLSNIVFADVLSGIAEGLSNSPVQPVFGVTDYDSAREYDVIRNMLSWRPSGMIVTGLDLPDDTRDLLQSSTVPTVQIMDLDGTEVGGCVGLSHRQAGEAMAEALIAAGRRRFGYVGCGLKHDTRAAKRLDGFCTALRRHDIGLTEMVHSEELSSARLGRQMTADILDRFPTLDCIYYSNDDVAAGGLYHCLDAGIEMPERLVLAGFNGLEFTESLPVGIATARTPRREIGRRAAQMVLDATEGGEMTRVELVPEIDLGPLTG